MGETHHSAVGRPTLSKQIELSMLQSSAMNLIWKFLTVTGLIFFPSISQMESSKTPLAGSRPDTRQLWAHSQGWRDLPGQAALSPSHTCTCPRLRGERGASSLLTWICGNQGRLPGGGGAAPMWGGGAPGGEHHRRPGARKPGSKGTFFTDSHENKMKGMKTI